MDGYYASNGYFSYSQTTEEMRGKDTLFDKLQTFVDERLLEIAAQIGVKQEAENTKSNNLDKLGNHKDNIDKLIVENESIQELKNNEYLENRKLLSEIDELQQMINDVKGKYNNKKLNHYLEMQDKSKTHEIATQSYHHTENDYITSKKAIRIELHEDKTLMSNLENSIMEADVILDSLSSKAKFSKKLESERRKMIKDRSVLLKDLCVSENVKYRKKTSTLPSYLDPDIITNPDGSKFENISTKVKGKLFNANGKLKHQSPESYKKRNREFVTGGLYSVRNKSPQMSRQSLASVSVDRFDKKIGHFRRPSSQDGNIKGISRKHKSP